MRGDGRMGTRGAGICRRPENRGRVANTTGMRGREEAPAADRARQARPVRRQPAQTPAGMSPCPPFVRSMRAPARPGVVHTRAICYARAGFGRGRRRYRPKGASPARNAAIEGAPKLPASAYATLLPAGRLPATARLLAGTLRSCLRTKAARDSAVVSSSPGANPSTSMDSIENSRPVLRR